MATVATLERFTLFLTKSVTQNLTCTHAQLNNNKKYEQHTVVHNVPFPKLFV